MMLTLEPTTLLVGFLPVLTQAATLFAAQSSGDLHAVYHERVNAWDTTMRVVMARSDDGGRTWSNRVVPLDPFRTVAEVPFGDYNGIDASQGRVVAAFPHFVEEKKVGVSVAIVDRLPAPQVR